MVIVNILLIILFVFLIRSILALRWNDSLADEAINKGSLSFIETYLEWSVESAIFNPLHFDKWTSNQWLRYFKKRIQV